MHLVPQSQVVRVLHLVLGDELSDRAERVEALCEDKPLVQPIASRRNQYDRQREDSRRTFAALQGRPLALTASWTLRAV